MGSNFTTLTKDELIDILLTINPSELKNELYSNT